jgi:hypothetical protein
MVPLSTPHFWLGNNFEIILVQVGRLMKGSTTLNSGEVQLLEENCFSIIFDHRSRSSKGGSYTLGKEQQ